MCSESWHPLSAAERGTGGEVKLTHYRISNKSERRKWKDQVNIMNHAKAIFNLLKDTYKEWSADKASRLAAALAYYTAFSIAPILIIVLAITGQVFGEEAVRGQMDEQIEGLVGSDGAEVIQDMVENSRDTSSTTIATIVGVVTLILGATGLFGQLQGALDTIWKAKPRKRGILGTIQDRFFSFTMVLGVAFLLLVSLFISAALSAVDDTVVGVTTESQAVLQAVNFVTFFLLTTALFAMIYKILPDAKIEWRDVIVGAAFTSLLFSIGKLAIGAYLGNSSIGSTYGAAGSFVVLLVWIYYSAQLLLFGAEFTQVYARRYGSRIYTESDRTVPKQSEVRAVNTPALPAPKEHLSLPVSVGVTAALMAVATFFGRQQRE
jgi:membrane protein